MTAEKKPALLPFTAQGVAALLRAVIVEVVGPAKGDEFTVHPRLLPAGGLVFEIVTWLPGGSRIANKVRISTRDLAFGPRATIERRAREALAEMGYLKALPSPAETTPPSPGLPMRGDAVAQAPDPKTMTLKEWCAVPVLDVTGLDPKYALPEGWVWETKPAPVGSPVVAHNPNVAEVIHEAGALYVKAVYPFEATRLPDAVILAVLERAGVLP